MSKEKILKQQKGSIAAFALATVFTLIFILGGVFATSTVTRKNQLRTLLKIKEIYAKVPKLTENVQKPIDTVTSYVGYYADMEGDGVVDGIIYADLAVGGEGIWNNDDWSNYQYSAISEGLKEYYVSKTGYEGIFGTKDVLSPMGIGKDRFYIMSLEDIKDEEHENRFCWYDAAYDDGGKLDKIVATDANDFGSGKENTSYVMAKWDAEEWGAKNDNGTYNDLWGAIKGEVAKGWFLPSKSEWSAFGDMLCTKCGVTSKNYNQTFNLGNWYWLSSQYNANYAYHANFDGCCISGNHVNGNECARLSTTF